MPARRAIPVRRASALGALALALVRPDPEQSRTLIAESLELNDALGGIVVDENALVMVLMASALLGERDACPQAFRPRARPRALAARRHVRLPRGHRRGSRPRRSPMSPPCSTEPSTRSFPASRRPNRTEPLFANARPQPSTPNSTRRVWNELRAQGAAMTEDQATEYALDAIAASSLTSLIVYRAAQRPV